MTNFEFLVSEVTNKKKLYNELAVSVLLYGLECWASKRMYIEYFLVHVAGYVERMN